MASTGGSPGILENVSSLAKRQAFLAGLNASEAQLGAKIARGGGVLSEKKFALHLLGFAAPREILV